MILYIYTHEACTYTNAHVGIPEKMQMLFMIKQLQQTYKPATKGVYVGLTQAFGMLSSGPRFKPPRYPSV